MWVVLNFEKINLPGRKTVNVSKLSHHPTIGLEGQNLTKITHQSYDIAGSYVTRVHPERISNYVARSPNLARNPILCCRTPTVLSEILMLAIASGHFRITYARQNVKSLYPYFLAFLF